MESAGDQDRAGGYPRPVASLAGTQGDTLSQSSEEGEAGGEGAGDCRGLMAKELRDNGDDG